jgi:hypothetical protein
MIHTERGQKPPHPLWLGEYKDKPSVMWERENVL